MSRWLQEVQRLGEHIPVALPLLRPMFTTNPNHSCTVSQEITCSDTIYASQCRIGDLVTEDTYEANHSNNT